MNLAMLLPVAALMTHILKGLVSLISGIFAMPEKPGLFVGRIIRFTVFFLLPLRAMLCILATGIVHPLPTRESVAGSKGQECGTPTVCCHCLHILVIFSINLWSNLHVMSNSANSDILTLLTRCNH